MTCEIIAEIGQNHNGDIELAKDLIVAAKEAGADVAKFQAFDAKALFPSEREGNSWFEYNCKSELSKDQIFELSGVCQKVKIEFLVTPFDKLRVKWLEEANVRRYKIASRSILDSELISAVEETGKPIIASLGMWDDKDMPKVKGDVSFLYCVSKYPTQLNDLNFSAYDFEKSAIKGFSDHTVGIIASIVAISRGAKIIEKHFTLDKKMYGPDHEGSMTTEELKEIIAFRNAIITTL